jgi:hypothetical protein
MQQWKNGDRAACRECTGTKVRVVYTCGHPAWLAPGPASEDAARRRCPTCRTRDADRARATEIAERAGAPALEQALRADPLCVKPLPGIDVDPAAPRELVAMWRSAALRGLVGLRAGRRVPTPDEATEIVEAVRDRARRLVPSNDDVQAALRDCELVTLPLGVSGLWPRGWLFRTSGETEAPASPEEGSEVAAMLGRKIAEWAESAGADAQVSGRHWSTPELTGTFTTIIRHTLDQYAGPGKVHTEVLVPVRPPGRGTYGCVDILMCRSAAPDVAVEIDSTASKGSARKIAFTRRAGAVAIAVSFNDGSAALPHDGVHVIDVREVSAALAKGRRPPGDAVRVIAPRRDLLW